MSTRELPANDWRQKVYARGSSQGFDARRKPRKANQERIRIAQNNRCLYCELPIGTRVWRGARIVILIEVWDHFVPYSYTRTNADGNWVLACQVCNGAKCNRIFDSVPAAREAILQIREVQGYEELAAVRLRLEQGDDPDAWPIHMRINRSEMAHYLRPADADFETACGRPVIAAQFLPPRRQGRTCPRCVTRRSLDNQPLTA